MAPQLSVTFIKARTEELILKAIPGFFGHTNSQVKAWEHVKGAVLFALRKKGPRWDASPTVSYSPGQAGPLA